MTVTVKSLIPAKLAENTQTTQYTAIGVRTVIDKFTITNQDSVTRTLSVNLVVNGDVPGTNNLILAQRGIAPGETYTCPELIGQVLEPSSYISTIASAASVLTITASGREIT